MKYVQWGILILILLSIWIWIQLPNGNLKIIFCDVGQGDGALISLGYFQTLIDTGEDKGKILDCIANHMPFWDRRLEVVFLSHSDSDHSGAIEEVERSYSVGRVVRGGSIGDIVRWGSLQFELLSSGSKMDGGVVNDCEKNNECSLVVKVRYGKFSGLFTGDLGIERELALIEQGVIKKADILKVAHHGSKFSSSLKFLEAVSPKLAVISVGAKNRYGHPSGDTLLRLDMVGAKVVRTDELGTIEVETDGEKVWMKK